MFTALIGGALIGLSALLLMLFLGRIAGICGMVFSLLDSGVKTNIWRVVFLISLVVGAALSHGLLSIPVPDFHTDSIPLIIAAGVLTGIGTRLGNGCTSGHGVCGIARFSARSIVATVTFMAFGIVTASLVYWL